MKQSILRWLNYSLILIFLFSCKKNSDGALDDFDPGRFDYVCVWTKNGIQDTVTGEVSGAYIQGGSYVFRVRNELEPTNKTFSIGRVRAKSSNPTLFVAPSLPLAFTATVTSCEHDSDHLWVNFQKGDTISGSFSLTRKE